MIPRIISQYDNNMRKPVKLTLAALALGLYLPAVARQDQAGPPASAAAQLEARFDRQLSPAHIGATIKALSAKPHHLGSAQGKAVAEAILARFREYGWDARIETYHVLFPTPRTRVLEMTAPTSYKALLKEPALPEDATSGQEGQLPTYNAWGGDGNVTGQLVYVNFGLPEDYDQLERWGIDVKGKIVIARYGRSWRGIKPKVAAAHGAIGCIIYSDPHEDGYYRGDVYPGGAFKNEYGVQRGAVMDMVIYPGDPLTPGIGAKENARRLERSAAPTILKIPVLPISYHDAQPLLAALEGPVAPEHWRGALPITYHVGPGKATVHLQVECSWDMVPAYNVIATIKGARYPDEWVVRGNHHDAWVNGAADPVSGIAALLEEAKAIGALVKSGYRPKRTLVYCAWDGEEQGLLGSTEWVEDHARELQQKAVAYINTDGNGRGFLGAGGSHALTRLVDGIAKDVIDPQTRVSVYERRKALDLVRAAPAKRKELLEQKMLSLSALGSGSDYSPFFQHLGVPSLNLGFGGEDSGGEYHSIYDSYDHYARFKDPRFHYGVALAQVAGRTVLRLADAEVLPFDFTDLYRAINGYVKELIAQAEQMRESTEVDNQLIAAHTYQLAADPARPFVAPAPKAEVPYLDFSPLQNALVMLERAGKKLRDTLSAATVPPAVRQRVNEALYRAEQSLLARDGLPRRPWFRHTIYAPGFYTGYGVKTLPGIREAMEQRNWNEAREQIKVVAAAVQRLSNKLEECIKIIE